MKLFSRLAHRVNYTFAVAVFSIVGGQVAAAFGILFLLVTVDLYRVGPWIPSILAVVLGVLLATAVHYALFGWVRRWTLPSLRRLNRHVRGTTLSPDVPLDDLERMVRTLEALPLRNVSLAGGLTLLVILAGLVAEGLVSGSWENALGVFEAGLIALALYSMFTVTATELITASLRREVRRRLARRGAWTGPSASTSLTTKLGFMMILLLISLIVVGSLLIQEDLERPLLAVAVFAAMALLVGLGLSVLIFFSITNSLGEIEKIATDLVESEVAEYISGSTDREFLSLADKLYQVAQQVVDYRGRLQALNVSLEEKVEERTAELMQLYHTALELAEHQSDLDATLRFIAEQASQLIQADLVTVWLWREQEQVLELVTHFHRRDKQWASERLKPGEGVTGRVWQTGQALRIDRYQAWEGRSQVWAEQLELEAVLGLPLSWLGRMSGVLVVGGDRAGCCFDERDEWLLRLFAGQAAVAIENARLYEVEQQQVAETRRKQRQLAELLRVSNLLKADLALKEMLTQVAEAIYDTLGFDQVLISVIERDEDRAWVHRVAGAGLAPEVLEEFTSSPYELPELAQALREQFRISQSYYIPCEERWILEGRFHHDPDECHKIAERVPGHWHEQDFLLTPLQDREGELIGMLAVDGPADDLQPTREGIELLELFANQAATALENARLLKAEVALRQDISRHAALVEQRTADLEKAYAELAQERNTLEIVLNNIADGLVVTDPGGWIALANPVFARMVGKSLQAVQGQSLASVFGVAALTDLVAEAAGDPGPVYTSDVIRDGAIYRAVSCGLYSPDQGQSLLGVVTVLRDVTQEVQVDQMKTNFISMVSHELRTPMTSVLGFAKLIHKSFVRDVEPYVSTENRRSQRAVRRIEGNLDIILSEGERLTRLINDVLDISKMEAGKIDWQTGPTDVDQVIRTAVTSLRALTEEKDLTLTVNVAEGLPELVADRDRLLQVVTNLLSNAIKFTDEGGIEVRAWQLEPGATIAPFAFRSPEFEVPLPAADSLLVVTVTDSGVGVAPVEAVKIFEKFHQVQDVLSSSRPRGTGLGLSISREIVEHHGGRIWVESDGVPGEGSRFVFTLPLA